VVRVAVEPWSTRRRLSLKGVYGPGFGLADIALIERIARAIAVSYSGYTGNPLT